MGDPWFDASVKIFLGKISNHYRKTPLVTQKTKKYTKMLFFMKILDRLWLEFVMQFLHYFWLIVSPTLIDLKML
jgi:hypothetical protein